MKLYSTSRKKPRVSLSAGTCYNWEEIYAITEPHIRADGCIYTLAVDFEGETFPLSHMSELPLVCKLVCAYHNALVKERIGKAYGAYYDPDADLDTGDFDTSDLDAGDDKDCASGTPNVDSTCKEWDEELLGDRRVYDTEYEINAHLVPWNIGSNKKTLDKFGMYS